MATEESEIPAATETETAEKNAGEVVYKTKIIEFLGRSTPIILQNDNGPCPLLAICNVLLLRNSLSLSIDVGEVTQQKLLSLVAEKLLDSNSNIEDKDDEYVSNQQQNISDAIDLLPCLATGIDVNVLFRKINDFEFTRECAIFDLLDIGLYHGWIVDPQDTETIKAIGSKSYNTLVAELVAFDTRKSEEEDSVDFAAATTATLGVPSPSISRGKSFDEPPVSSALDQHGRKGDLEEAQELMKALNLSKTEVSNSVSMLHNDVSDSLYKEKVTHNTSSGPDTSVAPMVEENASGTSSIFNSSVPQDIAASDSNYPESQPAEPSNCCTNSASRSNDYSVPDGSHSVKSPDQMETLGIHKSIQNHASPVLAANASVSNESLIDQDQGIDTTERTYEVNAFPEESTLHFCQGLQDDLVEHRSSVSSSLDAIGVDHSLNGRKGLQDVSDEVTSSLTGSEPIYEGEECILDSVLPPYEDGEPVYEGEVILAEQAEKADVAASECHLKDKLSRREWHLVKNFLEQNATQLTFYGLFCLQEGLKERELCVFFRNNHFSTMFKFKGELFLLATDQGYVNQPDLVWEKLNEVNGDTMFMTGNFKEFKLDNQVNDSWNEQNAMTNTSEYLASLENIPPTTSTFNSDLQLAIALQQQEFQHQDQPQQQDHQPRQQQNSQQTQASGRSRLITGPQVSRSSTPAQKNDSKTKEKCIVM